MAILTQLRRDLRSQWKATNPVIHDGEMILVRETENGPYTGYKIGDGVKTFNELEYGNNGSVLQSLGIEGNAAMSQRATTSALTLLETNLDTTDSDVYELGDVVNSNPSTFTGGTAGGVNIYVPPYTKNTTQDSILVTKLRLNKGSSVVADNLMWIYLCDGATAKFLTTIVLEGTETKDYDCHILLPPGYGLGIYCPGYMYKRGSSLGGFDIYNWETKQFTNTSAAGDIMFGMTYQKTTLKYRDAVTMVGGKQETSTFKVMASQLDMSSLMSNYAGKKIYSNKTPTFPCTAQSLTIFVQKDCTLGIYKCDPFRARKAVLLKTVQATVANNPNTFDLGNVELSSLESIGISANAENALGCMKGLASTEDYTFEGFWIFNKDTLAYESLNVNGVLPQYFVTVKGSLNVSVVQQAFESVQKNFPLVDSRLTKVESFLGYNDILIPSTIGFENYPLKDGNTDIYSNNVFVKEASVAKKIRIKSSVGITTKVYKVSTDNVLTFIQDITITKEDNVYPLVDTPLQVGERIALLRPSAVSIFFIGSKTEISGSGFSVWNPDLTYAHETAKAELAYEVYSENTPLREAIRSLEDKVDVLENAADSNPCLFDFVLTKTLPAEKKALMSANFDKGTTTDKGFSPAIGFANRITIDKYCQVDDIKMIFDVELTSLTANVCVSSTDIAGSAHASIIQFDFANQKIKIASKSAGTAVPTSNIVEIDMTNLNGLRYLLEVGRKDRQLYVALVNYKTTERLEYMVVETDGTGYKYPAGYMYDKPVFSQISGDTAYFKRIYCVLPANKRIVFMGDSITQGYGVPYRDCWAKKCADYYGDSQPMGRSGGTIDYIIRQLDDIVSVMKPQIVVVTIGTNGGNTIAKLKTVIQKIKNMGAVPVINTIYLSTRSDRGPDYTTPINNDILSLNQFGARFDIATALNHVVADGANPDCLSSDQLHLSVYGNEQCFQRFITDVKVEDESTLLPNFSENLIINSVIDETTPVSNRSNYLLDRDFIIPENPSDIGVGVYYGLSSSSLTGKTLTVVLKSTNKFRVLPVYYASGGEVLSSTYNVEVRVSDGWSYITTFIVPSDISMVYVIPYNVIQDFTVPNMLSFQDIGETYPGNIKDKVESNKEAVANLNSTLKNNLYVDVPIESYRSSLVATSNKVEALNKEVLTIPAGAGWGLGSYYGFVSGLTDLFGKEITVQLQSSTKLTKLPVWVNGGTSIPNIAVKEEQFGSDWLYTNLLNLVGVSSGNVVLQPTTVLDYTKETVWTIPFVGVKKKEILKDAIEDLYNSKKNGVVHYTIVTANSDENSTADFKGNLAIQQAFESITDANENNQYIVRATGNFLITSPNDYLNIPSLGAWVYIQHKDYVHLDGIDKDSCIIRCELSENLSEVQAEKSSFVKSDYGNYQPTFWNSKANISNVTFVVRNIRYPLHIDGGALGCKNYTQLVENCCLIHEGKYGDSVGTVGGSASGFGMSSGQQLTLRNCYLEGVDGWVYVHDNKDFTDGSLLYFDSCKFLDSVGYSREITIQGLNSLVASTIRLRNCTLPKHGRIEYTSSVYESTKLRADTLNYVCDMKDMCPMSVRTPASITKALRIVSKSTGSTSTVRVDPDSTAFSIIGFKDEVSLVPRNRYNRKEQYGYQYRDGGDGLQGEAIGFANVMENAISGKYLTSLGKRLGDCSTVNKTLTIVIDGTSYNVVFNKNYNGTAENALPNYTNAQIISEVNTVIGSVATIEEYDINKEWYPLFKDVQMFKVNSATYIEKGMGVVFTDNMNVRKATTSDTIIDGIALDNGVKGSFIRVMQSGCVAGSNSFHYSLSRGETFTDSANLFVGIVSDGKFGPTATHKTLRCLSSSYKILK